MNTEATISKSYTVGNEYGIHARPAALFVKCASKYLSDIQVGKDGYCVSGKSIMGLLTLEAFHGAKIEITAKGEDAAEAVEAIGKLILDNFGE